VQVLIAKQNIPEGTTGKVVFGEQLFVVKTIRSDARPEGLVRAPEDIDGKAAKQLIPGGAVLTIDLFS
jgi:flagella basal body P-ring formation protein FlgA